MSGEEFFFPTFKSPSFEEMIQDCANLVRTFFKIPMFNSSIENDIDVQDMQEFQKGNKQAFLKIYNRNKRKVYSWAYRMLKNEATAEEISQEVFIRIYKLQKNYEPKAKFTTLLYVITSRLVFNETRRKSRHPESAMEMDELSAISDVSNEWMSGVEKEQRKELLEKAIKKLPDRQRAVLMLRYIDEMSHDEICQVMELKIPAVKSLLHRGLESLSKILKQEGVLFQ